MNFFVNKTVWVEFYFTENVPVSWGRFDRVVATGLGTSRLGGLPHNKHCTVCNLYPLGKKDAPVDEGLFYEDHDEIVAKEHLKKMVSSMQKTGLSAEDCEDIVFLVGDIVDQVAYDTDVTLTVKNGQSIFGKKPESVEDALKILDKEKNDVPKAKGIASKIRGLHGTVSKQLDRIQSAIVKKKDHLKQKFGK
jgi:hypothetical protein